METTCISHVPSVKSPLLTLPAELRIQIYEQLLPVIICFGPDRRLDGRCLRETMGTPPIMKVCRQLREELKPIVLGDSGVVHCIHLFRHSDYVKYDSRKKPYP